MKKYSINQDFSHLWKYKYKIKKQIKHGFVFQTGKLIGIDLFPLKIPQEKIFIRFHQTFSSAVMLLLADLFMEGGEF